jgi:Family of unknown function (DUF5681)
LLEPLLYGTDLRFGKGPAAADRAAWDLAEWQGLMSETAGDYKVGPSKPPLGSRFKKGQSGNPGGRRATTAPAVLVRTLHEEVVVAARGRREKTTKREVVIVRLADKSAWPVCRCPRCWPTC